MPKTSISTQQNLQSNLELLAAQRILYSEAKFWTRFRLWFSIAFLVFPFLAEWLPSFKDINNYFVLLSLIFLAISYLVIKPLEQQKINLAAKIQERFDYSLFSLPLDLIPESKSFIDSKFKNALDRYLKKHQLSSADQLISDELKLKDWYTLPDIEDNNSQALYCQKSNLLWDHDQRKFYMKFFLWGAILMLSIPLVIAFIVDMSVPDFVTKIAVYVLPALFLFLENYKNHKEIVDQQAPRIISLERMLKNGDVVSNNFLIHTQDAIYNNRTKDTLVPDKLYWKLRDKHEKRMRYEAQEI